MAGDVNNRQAMHPLRRLSILLSVAMALPVLATQKGDVNADGRSDAVWRKNTSGENAVWLMNGAMIGSAALLPTVADSNWHIEAMADIDGDGMADVIWKNVAQSGPTPNPPNGEVVIWYMNGAAVRSGAAVLTSNGVIEAYLDSPWHIVAAGNFDLDAHQELMWRNQSTGDMVAWRVFGPPQYSATFQNSLTVNMTPPNLNWSVTVSGDFNGDGKMDLFWRNAATGEDMLWLMSDASNGTAAATTTVSDLNWKCSGAGDFDGDGKADLVWWNQSTGDVVVWLMNGANLLSAAHVTSVENTNWHIEAIGDFDADGKADLMWRNVVTGAVVVWLMNGTGLKQAAYVTTTDDANWQIVGPR